MLLEHDLQHQLTRLQSNILHCVVRFIAAVYFNANNIVSRRGIAHQVCGSLLPVCTLFVLLEVITHLTRFTAAWCALLLSCVSCTDHVVLTAMFDSIWLLHVRFRSRSSCREKQVHAAAAEMDLQPCRPRTSSMQQNEPLGTAKVPCIACSSVLHAHRAAVITRTTVYEAAKSSPGAQERRNAGCSRSLTDALDHLYVGRVHAMPGVPVPPLPKFARAAAS